MDNETTHPSPSLDPVALALEVAALRAALAASQAREASPVCRPSDAEDAIRAEYAIGELAQEHFWAIALDARQRPLRVMVSGIGTLANVEVHPRDIFREAIALNAHALIIAHNHPSGDAAPSGADLEITHRMVDAGRLLGIPVLDHLILTDRGSVSLASAGLMPEPKA